MELKVKKPIEEGISGVAELILNGIESQPFFYPQIFTLSLVNPQWNWKSVPLKRLQLPRLPG